MSEVGVVTIVLGVVVLCSRAVLFVAPEATLRTFGRMIGTDSRTRAFGIAVVAIGSSMIWAGASEESGLASMLWGLGWAIGAIGAVGLVLFPKLYRALYDALTPDSDGDLLGWRALGLAGSIIGAALVYFGVQAL